MDNQLSIDEKFLQKLKKILESNLEKEQFGVGQLAAAIGLSRSQLHRKLNVITGQSTSRFIREFRLKKAMEMLQNNVATASEIAYKVGFSSPTYFNTSFHQYYGYPPGEVKFRNSLYDENSEEITSNSPAPIETETKSLITKISVFTQPKYLFAALAIVFIAIFAGFQYTNTGTVPDTENAAQVTINEKNENSIAVLPFKNMSNSPDQQYFSDGVMEVVLNHLTALEGIRVISRTTSMRYKDTDKSIPEIAKELNVDYVLEGGVQENNGKIRINTQLIEARTDNHLWAEQYDRKFEDIFAVQTDIAKNIAEALNTYISQEEINIINQPITNNPVAYENYLRGKYLLKDNWSLDKINRAIKHFEVAIQLDPEFVEAYLWLGSSYATQGTWYGDLSNTEAIKLSKPYFDKAKDIAPDHPLLLGNMAMIKYFFEWDFKEASRLFEKAREQGNINGYVDLHLDLMLRRFQKVIRECKQEIESDPFAGTIYWNLAYAYYHLGEIDKALQSIEKGFETDPEQEAYYDHFGNLYNAMGMHKKAEKTLKEGLQVSDHRHASMVAHLAIAYDKLNQPALRDALIKELRGRVEQNESMINVFTAHIYAGLDIPDSAFYYLERSFERHEVDLIWLQADPNLLLLKDDPRYEKLLDKMGFPEENRP